MYDLLKNNIIPVPDISTYEIELKSGGCVIVRACTFEMFEYAGVPYFEFFLFDIQVFVIFEENLLSINEIREGRLYPIYFVED